MQSTVLKRFESPDATRTFEKGRFEAVQMEDGTCCQMAPDRAAECTT